MKTELTDQQAEDIVVMSKLCGITEAEAAARLGHTSTGSSRYPGDLGSWENTLKILQARKRLEEITKKAQN